MERKKRICQKCQKKQKQAQKLHAAGEYHTSFQSPNVQHVESLTEQWREMAYLSGNTEILSKLHTDVRANKLFYHSKCLKTSQYHFETFLNKSKENNTDTSFKKAVPLESTMALFKQKAYKNSECPVQAQGILEIYNSYLTNENLPQEINITHFGEMILYHTKEFEIRKNSHIVNIFILKAHFVKKTSSDLPFDCSVDFFKNARKLVTPIRKAISSLALNVDKYFDQIDSISSELISLIGLTTEDNSSSRNASPSTLTITGLIVYNYKEETHKRESIVDKVSINQLRKRETPVITYISLRLYCPSEVKYFFKNFTRFVFAPPTNM